MGNKASYHKVALELGLMEEEAVALHSLFSSLASNRAELSEQAVVEFFGARSAESFGRGLFALMAGGSASVTFDQFARTVIDGCRQPSTGLLRFYLKAVNPSHRTGQVLTREMVVNFLMVAYELAEGRAYEKLASSSNKIFDDIRSHATRSRGISTTEPTTDTDAENSDTIEEPTFISWANERAPFLPKVFSSWMTKLVFASVTLPSFRPFQFPAFMEHESAILSQADAFYLSIHQEQIQGVWTRLYTSDFDGLSFNRLVHHIQGYEGPTIVVARAVSGAVFGGFNAARWKLSNSFYGTADSFLFRIEPTRAIYKPKPRTNEHFVYLNTKGYALQHGIAFGGTTEHFRFMIPETFERCTAADSCLTYETGPLADATTFEIETLEVWGCGGEEVVDRALAAQGKNREDRAAAIRRARTVDKAQFANNDFDKEFLLSKTFGKR